MQLDDKDGDLIPDRLDSTFDPPVYRRQEEQDKDKYVKAFISPQEYLALRNNNFSFSKCNVVNSEKIAVVFSADDKAEYERILSSQRGNQAMKRR